MNKNTPWHKRVRRWGQTNLTEIDSQMGDLSFWKQYWKDTKTEGIVVNAGGIVAYYPSEFKMQYRAQGLGDRDLLGEFVDAADEAGIVVLARMDINRATKEFYDMHPDWFVVDSEGNPHTADGRYFSCVNSDYYKKYIPDVFREIIKLYSPAGFTDNSWKGVGRNTICYCNNCKSKFRNHTGLNLPSKVDWQDDTYKKWIKWSYLCRLENWDLFNNVTKEAGGEDCLWLGMINANPVHAANAFCDLQQIGERSQFIMCDHQSRDDLNGFEQNSLNGDLLHEVMGEERIIAESMANYVRGNRTFRRSANPMQETQMWMISGYAGGISPWFHHIGGVQEDRRQYKNAPPMMRWHKKNEEYLYERKLVANVGLVWSMDNIDFYGKDDNKERVELPWRGFTAALTKGRIAYKPINAKNVPSEVGEIDTLILPNLAVMTDELCDRLNSFVLSGGNIVLTGESGMLDEWGNVRDEFPLKQALGFAPTGESDGEIGRDASSWNNYNIHNYFRITDHKHPIMDGFEDTDILPFGGFLQRVTHDSFLKLLTTYIPAFPVYPPEFSWMREPVTQIPTILAGESKNGGRVVYFAGDIDRCYGRARLPDHGKLLIDAVKWAAKDNLPFKVEGPGYILAKLYAQDKGLVLHLVNLTGVNKSPGYLDEFIPVGPIKVSVKIDGDMPTSVELKVAEKSIESCVDGDYITFSIDSILSHELVVIR